MYNSQALRDKNYCNRRLVYLQHGTVSVFGRICLLSGFFFVRKLCDMGWSNLRVWDDSYEGPRLSEHFVNLLIADNEVVNDGIMHPIPDFPLNATLGFHWGQWQQWTGLLCGYNSTSGNIHHLNSRFHQLYSQYGVRCYISLRLFR